MFLGPILLIIAFVRIARRNEAQVTDDEDADLGDLAEPLSVTPSRPNDRGAGPAALRTQGG